MMRAFTVLLLAALAPAFAADAPSPADPSGLPDPPGGYVFISIANVLQLQDLLQRMTAALQEQDQEIARLRRLIDRGGCA